MNYANRKYIVFIFIILTLGLISNMASIADVTPVNKRTAEVRDKIVATVPGVDNASDITEAHLATITSLNLRNKGITELKSGDFSGLTGLANLNLYGNQLSSLPDAIFEGLTALTTLRLGSNTVDPIPITVSLEKVGEYQFKAVAPTGAPIALVLPLSVTNGSISDSATTISIAKGSVESSTLTVTRTAGTTDAVTVNIGTLPTLPTNHYGYTLAKSDVLPIDVMSGVSETQTPPEDPQPETPTLETPSEVPENSAPTFTDGTLTIRSIAENTAAETNIGAAVAATDANSDDTLTWTLSGVNAASFSIVSTNGQLKTKAALDYEMKRVYVVTITVSDGNLTDTILAIISIIDVYDTPLDSTIVPVSERTPIVRDAIVAAIPNVDAATDVTTPHLATVTQLNLRNTGISKLKSGDFSGLTALTNLNLHGNMLSSLPNGIFKGLTSLTTLRLGGNLANPMPLIVSLQQVAINEYRVVIPAGAPFDVVVPIDGVANTTMVTIPKGSVKSTSFTAMNGTIIGIGALPALSPNHFGYVLAKSAVCNRTLQVADAITNAVPGRTDCRNISDVQLAVITNLDLSETNITSLQSIDFTGLLTLSTLDLRNNELSSLPDGIFSGLTGLTMLNLDGNTVDPLPLIVSLEKVDTNQIKVVIPTGAPFDMVLPISVANGSLSENSSIAIKRGSVESRAVTVLRTANTFNAVTTDIDTLPSLPTTHQGYALVKPEGLPLEIFKRINVAPIFTDGTSATRTIAENTAAGTHIGEAIAATDANNDTLTYTLNSTVGGVSNPDTIAFDIDSTSGQLKTKAALDYETKKSYSVTIKVSDGTLTDTINVTINVTDVKENRAPVFTDGTSTTRSIAENTASDENIGTAISATDADDDTLTYSLGGTDASAFAIGTKSGQLKTSAALDYETKKSYSVTITVSDGTLTDTINVTINVTDVDENRAPVFTDGTSTTRTIAENTASDEKIGDPVAATDADDDTLTYSLGGTDASAFAIDKKSGQLKTSAALDYENKSSYSVSVSVSDGNLTDTITVTINITAVDEKPATDGAVTTREPDTNSTNNAPVFIEGNSTTRSVAENTSTGVDIGSAVGATDADKDTLTYVLIGTDASSFSIDSSSGQIRTSVALDYEIKSSYSVTITVSDGNGGSDSISVTINVSDVDESPTNNAPLFSIDSITLSVVENSGSGVDIGSVFSATDEDDDTLSYSLGGTDAASFSIDSETGQLKTSASLNFETKSSYSVTVIASDNNGGSDSISVTINVTNVNEAPVFSDGTSTTRSIAENVPENINIGSAVSATDQDEDDLTYTLGGTDATSFSIDSKTGQLKTKATLDYENKTSYSFTITVSDGSLTDTITVTIQVTNLDETPSNNPPVFTEGARTTRSVAENTEADSNIGTPIAATDADNNTLAYLLSGTDASSFSIDSETGQLKTAAALNHEFKDAYTVTVTVSDGSGTDRIIVTINVTDVNEAPVIAAAAATTLSIPENTEAGVNIGGTLPATDQDTGDTLRYTLGGTDAASFDIVSTTGQLRTKSALDFEDKSSYSVRITVSDGTLEATIDITINVTDVDENRAPSFTEGESTTREVAENTSSGVNIGNAVSATDAENDTLTYTLGGTNASSFSIVSTSGQLQTRAALDYETKRSYTVTISVSDENGGSDSIDVTINISDVTENTNLTPVNERTQQVKDTIVAAIDGVDSAADVTATHLEAITELDLFDESINALKSGDFDGLTALTSLDMNLNALSSLPLDIFNELTALTSLDLGNNALSSLPSGIFDSLTALTSLDLGNNALSSLPSDIFNELTALTSLDLGNNALSSLPSDIFDSLTNLVGLTLHQNGLSSLPSGVFSGLTDLTRITLYENEISDISPIDDLESLQWLYIDGNPISDYTPLRKFKESNPRTFINIDINNNPPVFTDGDSTSRSIDENTAAGTNIGAHIAATDVDSGDTLMYSLSGTDAVSFDIVRTSGQLQTKAALDYESKTSYTVIVSVSDGNNGLDRITVTINVNDVTGAAPSVQTPPDTTTAVLANYPNPFNPETWIPYRLGKPSEVSITIYDIRGNVVRRLDLGHQKAGFYTSRSRAAHWDGRNKLGERVANGIYFYQLRADTTTPLRKMVILK